LGLKVLVEGAENEIDLLMPGYTHLQRAKSIRWSHYYAGFPTNNNIIF